MPPKSRFTVRAHITEVRRGGITITDVRGPMTVSDGVTEYGHIDDPAEIALAAAERDNQRLHDACLELQDERDEMLHDLAVASDKANIPYVGRETLYNLGEEVLFLRRQIERDDLAQLLWEAGSYDETKSLSERFCDVQLQTSQAINALIIERDAARRWAAAWKRVACACWHHACVDRNSRNWARGIIHRRAVFMDLRKRRRAASEGKE
jgi:hypothetical protein